MGSGPSEQGTRAPEIEPLLDGIAAPVLVDADGELEPVNERARAWLSTVDEPSRPRQTLADLAERAREGPEPVDEERVIPTPDGEQPTRVRTRVLESGRVVLTLQPVSEYREEVQAARHQEQVLREAQEVAHIGSWEWDVRADEVRWSSELYRIFGRDPERFEGTFEGYMSCIHPDDVERVQSIVDEGSETGEPFAFDHRIQRPDGEVRFLHCRAQVIQDPRGDPVRMVGTAQDVTERREAEQRLKNYALDLERANQELQHFAYVASHDLKEPLRMISSYVDLLGDHLDDELDPTAREYMSFVKQGTARMNRLISDLLDYSRVDREGPTFERVDLDCVLDEVRVNLGPQIEETDGEIRAVDELGAVRGDESQLCMVLQNLCSNGLKFHCDGHPPTVEIDLERGDETWHLFVRDDGVGFDPTYEDRIFDMFKRLHHDDEYPGTGVGLAICRKIVHAHGGELWADSSPGDGSTFHVRIPLDPRRDRDGPGVPDRPKLLESREEGGRNGSAP